MTGLLAALSIIVMASQGRSADVLPPSKAFLVSAAVRNRDTVIVQIVPAAHHYLYKSSVVVSSMRMNGAGATIRHVHLPPAEIKHYPPLGQMEIYRKPIAVGVTLERLPKTRHIVLQVRYQGCNEQADICYPPAEQTVEVNLQ
jgi:thioredoxin:protein disulfide reductase